MTIYGDRYEALAYRKRYRGLIGIRSKVPLKDKSILDLISAAGVAETCSEIFRDPRKSFDYSCRGNTVAIVSDGSRVLGVGGMGPESALPVLESKAVILKTFAGVDAFPISLGSQDIGEIVQTITQLSPTFGAVCLEDVSAPRCFAIEDQLQRAMRIPVLHNDQHATAAVVLAGLINALKLVDKRFSEISVVINGAGAAGIAVAKILLRVGMNRIVLCDRAGAVYGDRLLRMNWAKLEISKYTNPEERKGTLAERIRGADVFIGLSDGGQVTPEMVRTMARHPIVFALAVPNPEILPEDARHAGARVVATGRTDYPNEIDVALAFPGFFRGLLDVRAHTVNDEMVLAAARALAALIPDQQLRTDYILPKLMDFRVAPAVAAAVARAAIQSGVAGVKLSPQQVAERTRRYVYEGGTLPPLLPRGKARETVQAESQDLHRRYQGILEVKNKIPIKDNYILSLFYLPPNHAVASTEIGKDRSLVYDYAAKGNLVGIVTDGSAVLGLGNVGPRAALPAIEGKAVLFNIFSGVDAFPLCLATQDPEEIVGAVKATAPTFGGICLEDIAAPQCFLVEDQLKQEIDIPVFHDDQHGTAVVVLAGLLNALKVVDKKLASARIVVGGAGAAGIAITRLLLAAGATKVVVCDSRGAIYSGRSAGMNWAKDAIARVTNREKQKGSLADAVKGADVFVGASVAGAVTAEMVRSMAKGAIVFALANPVPEITPQEAISAGAWVVATGRPDYPNQVENCLAFPGIFRGALDVRARHINDQMKIAAAEAIASAVPADQLGPDHVLPGSMSYLVAPRVAAAVARAAIDTGEARFALGPAIIEENTRRFVYEGWLYPYEGDRGRGIGDRDQGTGNESQGIEDGGPVLLTPSPQPPSSIPQPLSPDT